MQKELVLLASIAALFAFMAFGAKATRLAPL
jgi:hypothetical protein